MANFENENLLEFVGEKGKFNTAGTAGGPGGRDRTLAVKSLKKNKKIYFFS